MVTAESIERTIAAGLPCTHLAVSESIQDTGLILPLYQQMTGDEQGRVIEALAAAVRG